MDNFEMTKIAGAVLSALLLIFGTKVIIEERSKGEGAEKPGYTLPVSDAAAKADASKPGAATAEPAKDAAAGGASPGAATVALLGKANADNGKAIFSKCKACHVSNKGDASTVGPNLWGVVNRPRASYAGYGYSDAMKAKGGSWTFEEIGNFLNNPKGYVQGTKMVFNGLSEASDRADVIAYLATLADTPVPLPK